MSSQNVSGDGTIVLEIASLHKWGVLKVNAVDNNQWNYAFTW